MAKNFLKNFGHSIGYILFKRIFFAYLFFMLILASYQSYKEYVFAKELINKDMITAKNAFYDVLATSVWHFSEETLNKSVQAILSSKAITGIAIITPSNEVMILEGTVKKENQKYKSFVFQKSENIQFIDSLFSYSFELIDQVNSPNEVLANITFYTQELKVFDIIKENLFLIAMNAVLSLLTLWLLFIYFANKVLAKPLEKMIDAAERFEQDDDVRMDIKLHVKEKTELHILAQAFNKMSAKIAEDIINLKQLNMIQEKQKKDLVEANKYKNDFLANMSHELKTPLNSINVISSVMMKNRKGELKEEHVKNLGIINGCGNDLLFLINDVLDISKLEAGEIILNEETLDFRKTMQSLQDMIAPQAKEKNLRFEYTCDASIDYIYSDEQRIKQIVKNLLSNALKFAGDGGIYLKVKNEGENVRIVVQDEGIGIPQDKLEHIFDRFKQVDGSTTRKYGGTGLGLAICKELSVLLGGDITVNSKENEGTSFEVVLPKKSDQVQRQETPTSESSSNTSDNSTHNSNSNVMLLHNDPLAFMGLVVQLNNTTQLTQMSDLMQMVKEIKSKTYGVIIIDTQVLSASELQKVLTRLPHSLILVHDGSLQLDESLKDKPKGVFEKPVDTEKLYETISSLLK
jgi:signal transduction histidine kinase